MNRLRVIMPFYRPENKDRIIDLYGPHDVILHPIMTQGEYIEWNREWVEPVICSDYVEKKNPVNHKLNFFIRNEPISEEDHYWWMNDDDSFEDNVISTLKQQNDPVIFISMKRGNRTPHHDNPVCRHPSTTLFARPENVFVSGIGAEQMIVRGDVYRTIKYHDKSPFADGLTAMYLKSNYPVRYIENVFVKFNYFEVGRWD